MVDPPNKIVKIITGFLPQKSARGGNTIDPILHPTKNNVPTSPTRYLLSQINENSLAIDNLLSSN